MSKHIRLNKKVYLSLLLIFIPIFSLFSQVLIQEDFANYNGTASTLPTGWTFSSHGNYTSTQYSGNSGPNSYKFATNDATIITPQFNNADSVYFWIRGAGTDSLSTFDVLESSDSQIWDTIASINSINITASPGRTWGYAVQSTSQHLKFVYTKSIGNLAFDDFKVVRSQNQNATIHPADTAIANGKIRVYFNHPVDTTVSTGVSALNIGNKMLDTIVAYINRAKYSIDFAQYNYLYTNMEKIADAVNNAYSRGVKIRWIYHAGGSNTGLASLNEYIPTLGRENPSGLMHNKFVIIDAKSPNKEDAIVHTGSTNYGWHQVDNDFNNLVIFQDSLFADAYTKEFNQMWGSSGITPDLNFSKFGAHKTTVLSDHNFNIGGVNVELYFSPADPNNQQIINSINSADKDIYFGVFSFTHADIANTIKNKINEGVFSAGIMGNGSLPFNAYSILEPIMGDNLQIDSGGESYHSKMGIIDQSDSLSDPQVITGAHNWSVSADTRNDENTVIIHSAIAANLYYQSFYNDFNYLGGALSQIEYGKEDFEVSIYPLPFNEECTIQFRLEKPTELTIKAYNLNSKEVLNIKEKQTFEKGVHTLPFSPKNSGLYIVLIQNGEQNYAYKAIKLKN